MGIPLTNGKQSSYYQFQQSLSEYIYFSPMTLGGVSGRSVRIRKDLFLPFFCVVDPKTYDGQNIIRQIENLRTTTTIVRKATGKNTTGGAKQSDSHLNRLSKLNDSFSQLLVIKNLHVYYRVTQEKGDNFPSIYITNIRVVNSGVNEAAGLYESGKGMVSSKILQKAKSLNVDGRKVYINGNAQGTKEAMVNARHATNDENALLFYCPIRTSDELGVFGSSEKNSTTTATINELVDVFKQNQRAVKGVNWYVEGEAANLLAQAIKRLPGELAKHSFTLINPIANTGNLIQGLTAKKAILDGEFLKYEQNRAALVHVGIQKDQLMQSIGKLPEAKNYDIITRRHILQGVESLSSTGKSVAAQQGKLRSTTQTFVQLLKAAGAYRR